MDHLHGEQNMDDDDAVMMDLDDTFLENLHKAESNHGEDPFSAVDV